MINPFSLQGKIILITGASSGIGKSIAIECSKMGANLIITGRNKDKLQDTYQLLIGNDHKKVIADLTIQDDIERLVEECCELDGCVNCAGIPSVHPLKYINRDILNSVINLNTIAPILITTSLMKYKKLKSTSSIIFISSISGTCIGTIGASPYSTSKSALLGFSKTAALDLATKKIRVNTISPGVVSTNIFELSDSIYSKKEIEESMVVKYPLQRLGNTNDIAYGAIYLLSDASSWVTGINLIIDGGYTLN